MTQPIIKTYTDAKGRNTFLPFNLPAGRSGKVRITMTKEKAGTLLTVVSLRNAHFMGGSPLKVRLTEDTFVHKLIEDGEAMWMSTLPQEIVQHNAQLERAHGDVLVGGLGLGVAVGELVRNPKVKSITVVEKNADVIKLVKPHLPEPHFPLSGQRIIVVRDDLRRFLKDCASGGHFDFAFYDTWCPTGEHVLFTHILPLRRLSRGVVPNDQIECWNEKEMLGQVLQSLQMAVAFDDIFAAIHTLPLKIFRKNRQHHRMIWPFLNRVRQTQLSKLEAHRLVPQFADDLRDPAIFDARWGRYNK